MNHFTVAPFPPNETERLERLRCYEILDTASEQDFNDFTELASKLLDAPIALISLVDKDRQWFKSRVGLDIPETPRDIALCAHAILGDDVFEVMDAAAPRRMAVIDPVTATCIAFESLSRCQGRLAMRKQVCDSRSSGFRRLKGART